MRVFLKKVSFNVAEHLILIISNSKRQNLHWKASYDWLQNENARLIPAVLFCLLFSFFNSASQNIFRKFWKSTEARLTTFKIDHHQNISWAKTKQYGGCSESCNFAAITEQTLC